jgi:hypothetical protein
MSRDDLLTANAAIVRKATEETIQRSPDAIYVKADQSAGCDGLPDDEVSKLSPER